MQDSLFVFHHRPLAVISDYIVLHLYSPSPILCSQYYNHIHIIIHSYHIITQTWPLFLAMVTLQWLQCNGYTVQSTSRHIHIISSYYYCYVHPHFEPSYSHTRYYLLLLVHCKQIHCKILTALILCEQSNICSRHFASASLICSLL